MRETGSDKRVGGRLEVFEEKKSLFNLMIKSFGLDDRLNEVL